MSSGQSIIGGTSSPEGNATRMIAVGASSRRSMTALVKMSEIQMEMKEVFSPVPEEQALLT